MSIKDRMKVGQTWRCGSGQPEEISAIGIDHFLCIHPDDWEWAQSYKDAEINNWTLTHDSDGNPVCEFCGNGGIICGEGDSEGHICSRQNHHEDNHVHCSLTRRDLPRKHNVHSWPQEEEKPTGDEYVTMEKWQESVDFLGRKKGLIGWEDDKGRIYGTFRYKDSPADIRCWLTVEQWESGEWEVVRPVKLWFEGEES